jgi:hypothetical protein
MTTITRESIVQAMQQSEDLSTDEETRRAAFVRERALRDQRSELNAAWREGRQEGLREAWQQRWREGRVAALARLLHLKFGPLSESTQKRLEEADEARLDLLTERILSAQSLDELFA